LLNYKEGAWRKLVTSFFVAGIWEPFQFNTTI